jgi:hypothetical protein
MAEFPIGYSTATPSGKAQQVPYRMDVSTGAEYIERGIGAVGGALAGIAQKISQQEQVVDFSAKKRQIDEAGLAAHNAATGDEEADRKLWEKFIQDSQVIAGQSKWNNVNTRLQAHLNEVMPEWRDAFDKKGLVVRQKSAKAQLDVNSQKQLESGDLFNYYVDLQNALIVGLIPQEEYDSKIENAEKDSTLAQSRIDIGNGRYQDAINKLSPEFRKKLSGKQLDYADDLQRMAQETLKKSGNNTVKSIILACYKDAGKSEIEKRPFANQYIRQINDPNLGLTNEEARVMTDRVENWATGKGTKTDRVAKTDLTTQLMRARTVPQIAEAKQAILDSSGKLDDSDFDSLIKLSETKISDEQKEGMTLAIKDFIARNQTIVKPEVLTDEFQVAMFQWISEQKTPPSLRQIVVHGAELQVAWSDKTEEEIQKEMERKPIPVVRTDEDFKALKSGELFKAPDGTTRRKP